MTGKKLIHGYLDRLRENLETLDEQIVNASKMSKKKEKDSNALQWAKTLRDLVELRDRTLTNIKLHLLGRDETGSASEPSDCWEDNAEIMYERWFRSQMSPWTVDDLKLTCEDCGVQSEEVETHVIGHERPELCEKCYSKRTAKDMDDSEEDSEPSDSVSTILKESAETQRGGSVDSTMSEAVTGLVRSTIRAVALDKRSSAEKIKMLEDFKAKVSKTAGDQGSGEILEPWLALLDKEIERLRAEAGKGQDADGKPAA